MWEIDQDDWSLQLIVDEYSKKFPTKTTIQENENLVTTTTISPVATTNPTMIGVESYKYYDNIPRGEFGIMNRYSSYPCMLPSTTNVVGDTTYECGSSLNPILLSSDDNIEDISARPTVEEGGTSKRPITERQDRKRRRNFSNTREFIYTSDELATNDKWAWRKYGQKPIKDSLYQRSYYKCSTLKTCEAKKFVQPHPEDPDNTFIVTYHGKHEHPYPTPRTLGQHGKHLYITTDYQGKRDHSLNGTIPPQTDFRSIKGSISQSGLVGGGKIFNDETLADGGGAIKEESNLNVDEMIQHLVGDSDIMMSYVNVNNIADNNMYNSVHEVKSGSYPNMDMGHGQENGTNGFGFNDRYNKFDITNGMYFAPTTTYARVQESPSNMSDNIWVDSMIGQSRFGGF